MIAPEADEPNRIVLTDAKVEQAVAALRTPGRT